MRRDKNPKRKRRKFRILLDSAFAKPAMFSKLSKKANIAHVVHTYGLSQQVSDEDIYLKAILENRFVLTVNYKDFKKLVKEDKPGVFGIESQLTNDQIDKFVSGFLTGKNPEEYIGEATKIPSI